MSSRRSLYRTNRSHTSLYGPRTDTSVTHWQLDFVTINTTRDEDAPSDTPQKTNSFQVKTWVQVPKDSFKPLEDGVEGDTLPYVKYLHAEAALGLEGHETSEPPADAGKQDGMTLIPTDSASGYAGDTASASGTTTPNVNSLGEGLSAGTSLEGTSAEATAEGTAEGTPIVETPLEGTPASEMVSSEEKISSNGPEEPAPAASEPAASEPAAPEASAPAASDAAALQTAPEAATETAPKAAQEGEVASNEAQPETSVKASEDQASGSKAEEDGDVAMLDAE